jgi:hypothetical protein
MTRLFSILARICCAVSLLLFIWLVLFWVGSSHKPHLIWWNHAGTFPHYHVITIRDARLILAHYRETSSSPADDRMRLSMDVIELDREALELTKAKLNSMVNQQNADPVKLAEVRAQLENRTIDLLRAQFLLAEQRADHDLPPKPGPGWGEAIKTPRIGVRLDPSHADNLLDRLEPLAADGKSHFAGMSLTRTSLRYGQRRILEIPLWLILPVLLILPAMSARAYFRDRRRRKLDLCVSCGYDLRASADRCPECGAVRQLTASGTV